MPSYILLSCLISDMLCQCSSRSEIMFYINSQIKSIGFEIFCSQSESISLRSRVQTRMEEWKSNDFELPSFGVIPPLAHQCSPQCSIACISSEKQCISSDHTFCICCKLRCDPTTCSLVFSTLQNQFYFLCVSCVYLFKLFLFVLQISVQLPNLCVARKSSQDSTDQQHVIIVRYLKACMFIRNDVYL